MESLKRSRLESRNYAERRSYTKKPKHSLGSPKKNTPVNALIFDNGAYTIKIGYNKDTSPFNLPNHIMKAKSERKRAFIADQIEDCRDLSGLYFIMPHEKGYITKFDIQKNVWDYTFHKFPIDDNTVMMTQPIFNFRTIQEYTDEIFFEEYDVRSLYKANATDYAYYNYIKEFTEKDTPCLVVDSGYSFTHMVPYINGRKYGHGIIRLGIGGKLLTNYLKDIISYRQLHVMEETYVINQVKEDVCFMSQDFAADMQRAKNTKEIVKTYVLPDFHNIRRGYVQDTLNDELAENCQILRLNNERITIPEVMIRPSIINGMEVAGLAECIAHSIKKCPTKYQEALCSNVVFIGGNSLFSGFRDRLEKETRIFLPCEYNLKIHQPEDPLNYAWLGAREMSKDPSLKSLLVTKRDYEEQGSSYIYKKFNKYSRVEADKPKTNPLATKPFSYLNYWKNEGVDIFRKDPDAQEPNVHFKLEGDNIEEYDGKFVTIEFEYEKKEPADHQVEHAGDDDDTESGRLLRRKRQSHQQLAISNHTPTTTTSTTTSTTTTPASAQSLPPLATVVSAASSASLRGGTMQLLTTVGNINQIITLQPNQLIRSGVALPTLTRIQPVYKQLAVTSSTTTSSSASSGGASAAAKYPQLISLRNAVSVNDRILVPSTAGGRTTVSTVSTTAATSSAPTLLNNAVIVPQNMLASKNLTFQIIPIRPDMMRQGNIILTKKAP